MKNLFLPALSQMFRFAQHDNVWIYRRKQMHVPLTRIRKLIAKRMPDSKHSKPSFYLETETEVE